jgi:hypothetical protein
MLYATTCTIQIEDDMKDQRVRQRVRRHDRMLEKLAKDSQKYPALLKNYVNDQLEILHKINRNVRRQESDNGVKS